jgi:hypothetical protein
MPEPLSETECVGVVRSMGLAMSKAYNDFVDAQNKAAETGIPQPVGQLMRWRERVCTVFFDLLSCLPLPESFDEDAWAKQRIWTGQPEWHRMLGEQLRLLNKITADISLHMPKEFHLYH